MAGSCGAPTAPRPQRRWSATSVPGARSRTRTSSRPMPEHSFCAQTTALLAKSYGDPTASPGGTRLVRDIRAGARGGRPSSLTTVGGTLFFTANDSTHGRELWRSDGGRKGTKLVRDVYPGKRGSLPNRLTDVDGTLFFVARAPQKRGLWKAAP